MSHETPEPLRVTPETLAMNAAGLNSAQVAAAKQWAADDRLWTTREAVEFNLLTFARSILSAASPPVVPMGLDEFSDEEWGDIIEALLRSPVGSTHTREYCRRLIDKIRRVRAALRTRG